jgi:hypothetical protein
MILLSTARKDHLPSSHTSPQLPAGQRGAWMMQWLLSLAIAIVGEAARDGYRFDCLLILMLAICSGLAVFGFHGRVSSKTPPSLPTLTLTIQSHWC